MSNVQHTDNRRMRIHGKLTQITIPSIGEYILNFNGNNVTVKIQKRCQSTTIDSDTVCFSVWDSNRHLIDSVFKAVKTYMQSVALNQVYQFQWSSRLREWEQQLYTLPSKTYLSETMSDRLQAFEKLALKRVSRGILLHGKPGTGKTTFAYLVAQKFNRVVYSMPFYVDDDEFKEAVASIPEKCIIVMDDLDKTMYDLDKTTDDRKNNISITTIHHFLDQKPAESWVIVTANDLSDLKKNDALTRTGRIDYIYEVNPLGQLDLLKCAKEYYGIGDTEVNLSYSGSIPLSKVNLSLEDNHDFNDFCNFLETMEISEEEKSKK